MKWLVPLGLAIAAAAVQAKEDPTQASLQVRLVGKAYAECVVAKRHSLARKMILAAPTEEEIVEDYAGLLDPDCMNDATTRLNFSGLSFRGGTLEFHIAEALVRVEFPQAGPESFADRLPLVNRTIAPLDEDRLSRLSKRRREEALSRQQELTVARVLSMFGECAVRMDPERARRIIFSPVGSGEEMALLKNWAPQLGQCLSAESRLSFGAEQLRGTLAVSYFRLAHAPVGGETPSTAPPSE